MKSLAVFYYESGNTVMLGAADIAAKVIEDNFPNTVIIKLPSDVSGCRFEIFSPSMFMLEDSARGSGGQQ